MLHLQSEACLELARPLPGFALKLLLLFLQPEIPGVGFVGLHSQLLVLLQEGRLLALQLLPVFLRLGQPCIELVDSTFVDFHIGLNLIQLLLEVIELFIPEADRLVQVFDFGFVAVLLSLVVLFHFEHLALEDRDIALPCGQLLVLL